MSLTYHESYAPLEQWKCHPTGGWRMIMGDRISQKWDQGYRPGLQETIATAGFTLFSTKWKTHLSDLPLSQKVLHTPLQGNELSHFPYEKKAREEDGRGVHQFGGAQEIH